jgi:uncharacterized protein YbjT (DUF2867 family)
MILVTGATGNIGSVLLEELRGAAVRGLTRDAARAKFPDRVEPVEGDLTREGGLDQALEGVRSLFLLQGLGDEAEVLATAAKADVEHVVLVSSITV